jgi:hypothetical protein
MSLPTLLSATRGDDLRSRVDHQLSVERRAEAPIGHLHDRTSASVVLTRAALGGGSLAGASLPVSSAALAGSCLGAGFGAAAWSTRQSLRVWWFTPTPLHSQLYAPDEDALAGPAGGDPLA